MAVTYILRSISPSGVPLGTDWTNTLQRATATASDQSVSIAKGATEDQYAYTAAGDPGVSGIAGDITVKLNIITGNNSVNVTAFLSRCDSAGNELASTAIPAAAVASAGVRTITFGAVDLGVWGATDRLRLTVRFINTNTMSIITVSMRKNDGTSNVVVPWSDPPPGAPTNLRTSVSRTTATVEWDPPTTGFGPFTYNIYKDGGTPGNTSQESYMDFSVVEGATYSYEISAVNAQGEGPKAGPVTATPGPYVKKNSFDTEQDIGANVTVANSGGGVDNDPFDAVVAANSATMVYETTPPGRAGLICAYIDTFAAGGSIEVGYTPPSGGFVTRQYLYFPSFPIFDSVDIFEVTGEAATLEPLTTTVYVDLEANIRVRGAVSGFHVLSINTWYRLETSFGVSGASTLYLYQGDSTTPLATYEFSTFYNNFYSARFKGHTPAAGQDVGLGFYMDDVGLSEGPDLMGPTGATGPATILGTATWSSISTWNADATVTTPAVIHQGTAAWTATSTWTGTATRGQQATGAWSSASTWAATATSTAAPKEGTAAWSSTAIWNASAVRTRVATAAWASASSFSAGATVLEFGSATWSSASTWIATARITEFGTAAWSSASTWTATARIIEFGTAAWTSSSTWTATAQVIEFGTASWTSASTWTATVRLTEFGTAAWSSVSTWAASSAGVILATAAWTSVSTWTAAAVISRQATAGWTSASTWVGTASVTEFGTAAWTSASTWAAVAVQTQSATATWTSTNTWTGTARITEFGTAAWTSASTWVAAGVVTEFATAAWSSTNTWVATTGVNATWSSALVWFAPAVVAQPAVGAWASASTWTATATRVQHGSASWTSASTWTALATRTRFAAATWSSTSTWTGFATAGRPAAGSWGSTSLWSAIGVVTQRGTAAWTSTSIWSASGVVTRFGTAIWTSASTWTSDAVVASQGTASWSSESVWYATLLATRVWVRSKLSGELVQAVVMVRASRYQPFVRARVMVREAGTDPFIMLQT